MGKGKNGCKAVMQVQGEPIRLQVEDGEAGELLRILSDQAPTAMIMRGIPGSGKSTLVEKLKQEHNPKVHSTDSYHLQNGKYVFQPSRLGEFHKRNQQAFKESLQAGEPLVVCDNTNLRHWEYEPYLKAARQAGYRTLVVLVKSDPEQAAGRNLHGVSAEKVHEMYQRMEF